MKCKRTGCDNQLSGTWQKAYCSRSCAAKINNAGRQRNLKSGRWAKKPCEICETEHINKQYCSNACKVSARTMENTPERIKAVRAMKNEAWQRYEARKKNQTPADVDVKALQEIYRNCPEGYEVDHKHPISKGGLHHPDNLQYLTKSENRRKSDKII